uniref:cysteine dioxygenase n=1 Tax=Oryza sativa subsp. japonica TaxID=39947 RepID=Q656M4_ORYSJ|nr:HGWP repeat containing protein-like [Oryza sativa Japonica Group]
MLVMDSRRLSFPVDRPRVHSAGLSSPPPLLIATTTSPPACLRRRRLVSSPIRLVGHTTVHGRPCLHRPAGLRRRRLVFPPARLAYYAAAVGRLRLHRRPASVAAEWCLRLHGWPIHSVAADWCPRLHGWPIMPPLLGVYDFTAGLPPSPPSGASAYTAGLLCRRCWASTTSPPACLRRRRLVPPPTRLAYYAAAVGRLRLHRRPASVAADWCLRLHGWPIMPPLLGVYDFTAGLPPSPPTGASAYTAGLLCRRCWASTTSPPACLRRCRLVSSPPRLVCAAAVADGDIVFTAGLPPSPLIGVFAYMVGWSHHRCWASTSSPPACLRCRRVVPPPTRLAYYAAAVGRPRLHRRPASVAADWCHRLYGRLVTPPFMGVHVFTAGMPPLPPSGASAYTAGLLCRRCWASTTSPPACLRRRRLVSSPVRLVGHTTVHGRPCLHRRHASVAAEWCLRLHGWPIMPPLLGVHDFTAGLPPLPPSGASAYTAGLLCRRC